MEYELTGSIVLYNNDESIRQTVECFLRTKLKAKLYLIDNSPTNKLQHELSDLLDDNRTEYIFNNKNIGFGAAHNIAFEKVFDRSKYHLVLNPDVEFEENVLEELYTFMEHNKHVGQVLPKVVFRTGELQKLCKLLPSPIHLLGRRFCNKLSWAKKLNEEYELEGFNYDKCLNLPNLSGCFMFLRVRDLKKTGGFDKRYFMYMEDIDLTRRMHKVASTIFYPYVTIVHDYRKGSYSNTKLLKYHIESAIKYFNKWGWFNDREKSVFNDEVIKNIHASHITPEPVKLIRKEEKHAFAFETSNNKLKKKSNML